jgi:hypothetical protein
MISLRQARSDANLEAWIRGCEYRGIGMTMLAPLPRP